MPIHIYIYMGTYSHMCTCVHTDTHSTVRRHHPSLFWFCLTHTTPFPYLERDFSTLTELIIRKAWLAKHEVARNAENPKILTPSPLLCYLERDLKQSSLLPTTPTLSYPNIAFPTAPRQPSHITLRPSLPLLYPPGASDQGRYTGNERKTTSFYSSVFARVLWAGFTSSVCTLNDGVSQVPILSSLFLSHWTLLSDLIQSHSFNCHLSAPKSISPALSPKFQAHILIPASYRHH